MTQSKYGGEVLKLTRKEPLHNTLQSKVNETAETNLCYQEKKLTTASQNSKKN